MRSASGLTVSAAWRAEGETSYCSDGQVFTAASAIRWLQDTGLLSGPSELDLICSDDARGTTCIPAMAGLAAPWWRADAQAVFHGISLATTRADLVTAVLQGLAAQVAELGDLVAKDSEQALTRLRVDGGLTRSARFMQSVADLMQIEIDVYPSAHATPLGAAALARKALDPALSLEQAIVSWAPARTFAPVWSADRAATFRAHWRRVVDMNLE
ncbi:MAG: FGGY-family carbohydrate kinase [Arachnia sp.]